VLALGDGVIKKLFNSRDGGLTIYHRSWRDLLLLLHTWITTQPILWKACPCAAGRWFGYVGTTGNAPSNTPHLHLAIFKLGPEKRWWQGTPVNPYPVLVSILKK